MTLRLFSSLRKSQGFGELCARNGVKDQIYISFHKSQDHAWPCLPEGILRGAIQCVPRKTQELIFPTVYSLCLREAAMETVRKSCCTKACVLREWGSAGPERPGNLGWKVRSGLLLGRWAGCWVEVGGEGMWGGGNTWVKGRLGRWWMGKVERGRKGWDEEGAWRMVGKVGGIQGRATVDFQDCSQSNR